METVTERKKQPIKMQSYGIQSQWIYLKKSLHLSLRNISEEDQGISWETVSPNSIRNCTQKSQQFDHLDVS